MKKLARTAVIMIMSFVMGLHAGEVTSDNHICEATPTNIATPFAGVCDITPNLVEIDIIQSDVVPTCSSEQPETEVYEPRFTDEEIELIARVAYAEAEGESDYGQRLVVDTIINRVDDPRFPDTVEGVIYAPNQFDIFENGRIDRVELDEHIIRIVCEESNIQENCEVLFFNSEGFNNWSEPLFQEGNHYFSKSKV